MNGRVSILVGLVAVLLATYISLAALPRRTRILIAANIILAVGLVVLSWR